MEGISRVTDLRKLEQRKWKAGDEPPLTSCKHSVGKEQIWTTSAILLTPCHRGRQSSINTGGNFPPNDSAWIWWNSQKAGSILNYEDLKAKFQSHFSQQKRFTKTHLAVHNIKQREGEIVRAFATRYTDDTLQILGLHEDQRISGFIHGLKARNLVEHLSIDLPSTYKGFMEKTYTWIEEREVAINGSADDLEGITL
ncbi:reverse transcriptase domain-containing protein [Tanacetum coccineum]